MTEKKDYIKELHTIIIRYERKYQMKTEEFIHRYVQGEFEMDDDYPDYELAHWQGSHEACQRLIEAESKHLVCRQTNA